MTRLSLFLLVFLLLQARSFSLEAENGSEDIPSKWPAPGEHRPDWWIWCYGDDIIVVEGSIAYTTIKADEIKIETSDEGLKKLYGKRALFIIGHLVIKKVFFAASGIELPNENALKTKVLISTFPGPDGPIVFNLARGKANKGVFIFHRDRFVSELPVFFAEEIPSEGVNYALKLFAYRKRFGHPPPAIPDGYFR